MPQRQQQYLKQRKLTDERMFYDWTSRNAEVYARPTDPYVRPAVDAEVSSLLAGIKALKTGFEAYGDIQQANIPKNKIKAQTEATADYMNDPNNPNPDQKPKSFLNAGWGYDQAYYMSFGEAKGIEFKKELTESLLNNNYFLDSANPDEEKEKLYGELWNKHFQGMNEYAMFGANANVKAAIAESEANFTQAKYLKTKETFINSQTTILFDQAQQYIESTGENPVFLNHVVDNLYETNVTDTGLQSKEEYNKQVITAFGDKALSLVSEKTIVDGKTQYKYSTSEAAKKGMKLIGVFKAPGKNGVSLYDEKDENGNFKYRTAIDTLEDSFIKAVEAREDQDESDRKKIADTMRGQFVTAIYEGVNVQAQIIDAYNKGLIPLNYQEDLLELNRVAQRGDYDVIEDDNFVLELESGIYAGTKGRKDIENALTNRVILTSTAQRLNRLVNEQEKLYRSERKEDYQFYFSRLQDELKPNFTNLDTESSRKIKTTRYSNALREFNNKCKKGIDPEKAYVDTSSAYQPMSELEVLSTIPEPDYRTHEAIIKAKEKGKITAQEANEQFMRLQAWQRREYLKNGGKK